MGGRGAYSLRQIPEDAFEIVSYIDDVRILEKTDKEASKSLPENNSTNKAYLLLDDQGTFRMYREYNSKHQLTFEIGYHIESSLSASRIPILHAHDYLYMKEDLVRGPARLLTFKEAEHYLKYFKGCDVMVGMTLTEFAEKLSCGTEIEFQFNETTYFVQGYFTGTEYALTLDQWSNNSPTNESYLLDIRRKSPIECADAFFEAAVFDGKTLYEIEHDILVKFG